MQGVIAFFFLISCASSFAEVSRNEKIKFDRDFLDSLTYSRAAAVIQNRELEPFLVKSRESASQPKKGMPRDPTALIFSEVFKFFYEYISSFSEQHDSVYATRGDFRMHYQRQISKKFPSVSLQGEAYRINVLSNLADLRLEGGGGGVRWDFTPNQRDILSVVVMPFYGEKRRFSMNVNEISGGTQFIWRTSTGISYHHRLRQFGDFIEPGALVFFQPQVLDFSQFRVYAETYVRLKVVNTEGRDHGKLVVQELNLVPKFVFWHSTDEEGIFGKDALKDIWGNTLTSLDKNLYGFLNIELKFRM